MGRRLLVSGIRQLPKIQTGNPDIDRALALHVDTLNPILRGLPLPGGFKWVEVPGLNGAPSTFALQYGGGSVATFTSAGQLVQPAWIAPTLINSWTNFGGGNPAAGYMKDALGFVHLRGMVGSGTVGAAILTLPVGYRPALSSARFAAVSNAVFGYVSIDNAGNVVLQTGSNVWVQLDGITFDTRS
jgi:hypothetical protein